VAVADDTALVYKPKDSDSIPPHRATIFFSNNGIATIFSEANTFQARTVHQGL